MTAKAETANNNTAEFKVDDYVVYPAHGVGRIIDLKEQEVVGMKVAVYIISFNKDKMVLSVPVNRAKKVGLRQLSNNDNIDRVLIVLKGKPQTSRGMWSKRAQEYENKINSGDIISIAEVVRDLHKNVDDPERSYSERMIYESALDRLAGEFAAIQNIEATEAIEVLTNILKQKLKKQQEAA
ncbi:MAG: CarD family transcriptional regulator [Rickettsiales bacterium]|nr:CarD family transcriptional regulator [Rickettsiales bacterium]